MPPAGRVGLTKSLGLLSSWSCAAQLTSLQRGQVPAFAPDLMLVVKPLHACHLPVALSLLLSIPSLPLAGLLAADGSCSLAGMAERPDWLALSSELWLRVLASSRPPRLWNEATLRARGGVRDKEWLRYRQLVAAAACTCRQLCGLVQSPAADGLFEELYLGPPLPRLPAEGLPDWRRCREQHAQRARMIYVLRGAEDADHLHAAVRRATALTTLKVSGLEDVEVAAALGSALALSGCPLTRVLLYNCALAPRVPASVQIVHEEPALVAINEPGGCCWVLHNFSHLHDLRRLRLSLLPGSYWSWTAACSSRLLQFFPHLEALYLTLTLAEPTDLAPLRELSCQGCELRFRLRDVPLDNMPAQGARLSAILQQLLSLPAISELQLHFNFVELTRWQQQTLARHAGLSCLTLCGEASRYSGAYPHVRQLTQSHNWAGQRDENW